MDRRSRIMRITTAYFAGVGTVVAAVAMGLGGGLLISNIVSPHEPKVEMSKLELRMSSKPIPASNAPAEPAASAAATQPTPSAANTAQVQPPQPSAQPAETVATNPSPPSDPTPAAQAAQPAPREPIATPENAFAKARDADVKRVTEKRRVERRQQWTERRRYRPNQDQELRDVEAKVREETEPRQSYTAEPVRLEMPRIRLFDPE
jgi:hypothetical protein